MITGSHSKCCFKRSINLVRDCHLSWGSAGTVRLRSSTYVFAPMTLSGPTSAVGQGKEEQIENMWKTLQKEHEKQIKALKEQIVQVKQDHEQSLKVQSQQQVERIGKLEKQLKDKDSRTATCFPSPMLLAWKNSLMQLRYAVMNSSSGWNSWIWQHISCHHVRRIEDLSSM